MAIAYKYSLHFYDISYEFVLILRRYWSHKIRYAAMSYTMVNTNCVLRILSN